MRRGGAGALTLAGWLAVAACGDDAAVDGASDDGDAGSSSTGATCDGPAPSCSTADDCPSWVCSCSGGPSVTAAQCDGGLCAVGADACGSGCANFGGVASVVQEGCGEPATVSSSVGAGGSDATSATSATASSSGAGAGTTGGPEVAWAVPLDSSSDRIALAITAGDDVLALSEQRVSILSASGDPLGDFLISYGSGVAATVGDTVLVAGSVGGFSNTAFLAHHERTGRAIWRMEVGAESSVAQLLVGAHGDGAILLAGSFRDTIDLGGDPVAGTEHTTSFVTRLDEGGAPLWIETFGGVVADTYLAAVAPTPDGGVLAAGSTAEPLDLAGEPIAAGESFVLVLDSEGVPAMARSLGVDVGVRAVAPGPDGTIVVLLRASNEWRLRRLDAAGETLLDHAVGNAALALAVAPDGTAFVGGTSAAGNWTTVTVASFSPDGELVWSGNYPGDNGDDEATAVAVLSSGDAIFAGFYDGEMPMGPHTLPDDDYGNGFVARFVR